MNDRALLSYSGPCAFGLLGIDAWEPCTTYGSDARHHRHRAGKFTNLQRYPLLLLKPRSPNSVVQERSCSWKLVYSLMNQTHLELYNEFHNVHNGRVLAFERMAKALTEEIDFLARDLTASTCDLVKNCLTRVGSRSFVFLRGW